MPIRLWLFQITPRAKKEVEAMPPRIRDGIFIAVDHLLEAIDPSRVPGVKKIQGTKITWRQRYSDYRILFELDTRPVDHEGNHYKGKLIVVGVRKRDESTYR